MKLLSMKALTQKTSLSRAQIQRMVKAKTFPSPVTITPRRKGWIEQIVDDWIITISGAGQTDNTHGVQHDFV